MSYYNRLNHEEKLNKLNGMIERAKIAKAKLSEKERKKRARTLIQKGALLEKYFNSYHLTVEQTEELLKIFSAYVQEKTPTKFKKDH